MSEFVVSISKQGAEPQRSTRRASLQSRAAKHCGLGVNSRAARVDSRVDQENLTWVLLLDDDPINTRGLSRWLKQTFGVETRSARTIQQAERWLMSMPAPCAIVSDFDLEGTDTAVTALGRFQHLGVKSKALVLTGAPTRARAALLDAGWTKTPVLSKANFQAGLAQWLLDGVKSPRRMA